MAAARAAWLLRRCSHSISKHPIWQRTCEAPLLLQDGSQAGVHVSGHAGAVAAQIHPCALPAREGKQEQAGGGSGSGDAASGNTAAPQPALYPVPLHSQQHRPEAAGCPHATAVWSHYALNRASPRIHLPGNMRRPVDQRILWPVVHPGRSRPHLAIMSCSSAACCCIRCCTYTLWAWAREKATCRRSSVPSAWKPCRRAGGGAAGKEGSA